MEKKRGPQKIKNANSPEGAIHSTRRSGAERLYTKKDPSTSGKKKDLLGGC